MFCMMSYHLPLLSLMLGVPRMGQIAFLFVIKKLSALDI